MAVINSGNDSNVKLNLVSTTGAAVVQLMSNSGQSAVVDLGDMLGSAPPGIVNMGMNDGAAITMRTDRIGNTAVSTYLPLLTETFEGTTISPARWTIASTTTTATSSSIAGLTINSGAITTINTGYLLTSSRRYLKIMRAPLHGKLRGRVINVNNSVAEFGFGDASTATGAHTTGAFWQWTSAGVVQPVIMFNGTSVTGADISSLIVNSNYYTWDIIMDDDDILFICQDTATGALIARQSIKLAAAAQRLLSTTQIGFFARQYNTGSAPATAPQFLVTDINVLMLDLNAGKPWPHIQATQSRGMAEHPLTGAQTPAWANSAEPASATLSNTAAGYTTLGGKFQFAAPAGAVTDFALFAYTVPVPTNFVITGVDIETWNTGAASATTPTLLTWALGMGATAVSLAGTLVRVGLGAQSIPVGAAIGAMANRITKQFLTPLTCPSGRFIHIILRVPVGTATASQVIAGMVNIEGYSE